jgi:hypothetical protein
MAPVKSMNVMHPSEEAAKKWANKIKREKEEQKKRDQEREAQKATHH